VTDEQTSLTGPDFSAGVAADDVTEGKLLAGHAGGEAVLLTRVAGRACAVGALCTHYGAPLADGLVVDGTIRCPWHHAAFRLDTGEVARPPALNDLPCFSVEEKAGRVTVTGKRTPREQPPQATPPAAHPQSIVIVGGGAAGSSAAATLRREGYRGTLTLVSAERTAPVDRPTLSKDFLAGHAQDEWVPLHPDAWYAEREIRLLLSRRVVALEPAARRVRLDDGTTLEFGALLLATGADPIRLQLGDDARLHYLRTFDDSQAIISAAASARNAVVMGASFIGLEVAAALRARGVEVMVVAPEAVPLERVLGTALGRFVRELHEEHGVRFRLGRAVRYADAQGVTLDDGERLAADLVVAGVGVRPNVALAQEAGLAVDRGIVVNEFLETGVAGVFAAGDVARWPDAATGAPIRVEHWVVAERQGETAARNMLGARERHTAVPFFWSAHYDVTISYVGHSERPDEVVMDGDPRSGCTVRFLEQGRVAAVATIGRDRESLGAEVELEHQLLQTTGGFAA
jgi:NADPH-dependent 2,4-dienoyl-CoA reductase/sulfur reductase-like enzyme/nitrite reductase/ring-hydroxylating ferredoxin subunit